MLRKYYLNLHTKLISHQQKRKKRLIDLSFQNSPLKHSHSKKVTKVKKCTEEEKLSFFKFLADCNNPAAILRVPPKYSENFIPHTLTSPDVLLILTEVFNKKYTKLNYGQLLIENEKFFNEMINITCREVEYVLEQTKGQGNSNLWFRLRAGPMTASNIRHVCKTNSDMPSVSLLKKNCYRTNFRSVATDWGCKQEQVAKCQYKNLMKNTHSNFLVVDVGLCLSST